jgi:hypothetical protein
MPSTLGKKKQIIGKIFGDSLIDVIVLKIKNEGKYDLKTKSDQSLRKLLFPVASYIDNFCNSDYSILNNYTLDEINKLWAPMVHNYILNFTTKNYIEKHKIIIDRRANKQGFYWIDHEKCFSLEMDIMLENCGRVNVNDTLYELREVLGDNLYSRVGIVLDKEKKIIRQIKGIRNEMPNQKYWDMIFDFLWNGGYTDLIYVPQFQPHNDFKVSFFSKDKQDILKIKHPKLFPQKTMI